MDKNYPSALKEGTVLNGEYIIKSVLGQGGFGITYEATGLNGSDLVAIKEYFPDTMASRSETEVIPYTGERGENFSFGKECFLEEARILADFIGNLGIVGVKKYFEENGTAYFVMEYIQGMSFKDYLEEKGGRIPVDEAIRLLTPVMDALSYVHATGLIHRDVTPDNIYVTDKGQVRLLDFGAARYSMGDRSMSLDVVLKHGYAPKEQYTRRGKQGPYTDIYSLAATIYRAITGQLPPDSIDRMEKDDLKAPAAFGIKISGEESDAILKALSVDQKDRFQTMEEFKAALVTEKKPARPVAPPKPLESPKASEIQKPAESERLTQSEPAQTNRKETVKPSTKTYVPKKGHNKAAAVVIALVAILAIAGLGVTLLKRQENAGGAEDAAVNTEETAEEITETKDTEETEETEETKETEETTEASEEVIGEEHVLNNMGVSFRSTGEIETSEDEGMAGISYKDGEGNDRNIFIIEYGPCGEVETYPDILKELAQAADINMTFTSDLIPLKEGKYPGWYAGYSYSAMGEDRDGGIVYLFTPMVGDGKELTMLMGDKTETMDEILHSIRIDGAQEEDLSGVDVSDTYKL
ncbi:MAG: serine/threonine protein kinase [Lachnospiraceae bacterium]|nr:serine/threonine protein kinase [Lachnospiraceae bacterium]